MNDFLRGLDRWLTRERDDCDEWPDWYLARCDDCGEEYRASPEDDPKDDEPRRCDRCVNISKVTLEDVWARH